LGKKFAQETMNFLSPSVSLIGEELQNRVDESQPVKNIADCVESMIGASLVIIGMAGA
jgi:hypothetical protein